MQSTLPEIEAAPPPLVFKLASQPWEFEQIHRLNYQTFVEEIPQHGPNDRRVLVDRFHQDNAYIVCLSGREVLGMMCIRDKRPFSLEQKVADLWSYLPPAQNVCEIRLLASRPDHRGGRIFSGLAKAACQHCIDHGYDLAIISGTVRQLKLYRHLGFVAFGPLIGTPGAMYQPMYMTLEVLHRKTLRLAALRADGHGTGSSFLPGPVPLSAAVRGALADPAISHRTDAFADELRQTRKLACELVNASHVQLLMGTGTLANDAVAAQLCGVGGAGVILSNGEFGQRLIDAAERFSLSFEIAEAPWGQALDMARIEQALAARPAWLWFVHCETSTGVLNDLAGLRRLCAATQTLLCADCISSIGTMPLDLNGVWLATATSGKGIAALPGIAMVFHHHEIRPSASLPRYLDLGVYAATEGVPFTFSSNLLHALRQALRECDPAARLAHAQGMARELREGLEELGLHVVAADEHASPAVITIALPPRIGSVELGQRLAREGCLLSFESEYLRKRNWMQVCLMGEHNPGEIAKLLEGLRGHLTRT